MRHPLYLFLPALADEKVVFVGGEDGLGHVRREPAGVAASAARGQKCVLVVPGRDVLLTWVEPPKGAKRRQLEKAVPFLLEDDLLSPVEQLHFSLGRVGPDGRLAVAVVARKVMDAWMAFVNQLGIQPYVMICDTLLLPLTPGTWHVYLDEETAWVRLGANDGFMIERANLLTFLTLALKRSDLPERIHVVDFSRDVAFGDWSALPVPVERVESQKDRIVEMVAGGLETGGLNLLQGAYRPKGLFGGGWKQARWSVALLAVWMTIRIVIGFVELGYLEKREAVLKEQSKAVLTGVFPDMKVIVNPKAQMMQRLAELKGREGKSKKGGFMEWLTKVGLVTKGDEALLFSRVSYREGILGLIVKSPDKERLERLVDSLTKQHGLHAVLRKTERINDGIEGQIDIGVM
ncbi:MAG: hypothetical protein HQL74_03625 [Magnetococcales bacterium]|nr:hypothetical protein [Magnetococcales bacterium]